MIRSTYATLVLAFILAGCPGSHDDTGTSDTGVAEDSGAKDASTAPECSPNEARCTADGVLETCTDYGDFVPYIDCAELGRVCDAAGVACVGG